jgi:hypothetical protein
MLKPSVKASALLISITLILTALGASTSHGDANIIDPNEGWTVPNSTQTPGSESGLFSERSSQDRPYSALLDPRKINDNTVDPTCAALTDPKCSLTDFIYFAQIPVCQADSDVNCIETIGAVDSAGKNFPGIFQRAYPRKAQNAFAPDLVNHLPEGATGSLFTIPGVSGPAGNLYYTSLVMSGQGRISGKTDVSLRTISAQITPVQIQAAQYNKPNCAEDSGICNSGWVKQGKTATGFQYGESGSLGIGCAANAVDEDTCAEKEAFPAGYKFYLKARMSLAPSGWLHGRMSDPNISLTQANGITELQVTASPVAVPIIFKTYLWKEMPPELQSIYEPTTGRLKGYDRSEGGFSSGFSTDPNQRAWTVGPAPYEETAFTEINAWLPHVNNTATAIPHYWSFRSLTPGELASANQCFTNQSQLNGIVTTNSTVYSPGPPSFDKSAGNLNYKVAAPHFTNTGEVFTGTYDLVMRSAVARCIYGFSSAPVKASISVVSATGSPEVATTVVGEKDGWLHLSANGFEFSAPTIAVNLTQDAPVVVPPPAAPVANTPVTPKVVTPQKKASIVCTKGKMSKTISGITPKCPAGYKVKK